MHLCSQDAVKLQCSPRATDDEASSGHCLFVCFVVLFCFCFCFLLKVHVRQWQKSKTQSWVNLRRRLWAFPRVKHDPRVPTWGACSLAFVHCQALLMGQLWEPGTVVGLLGAHKLAVTPPDIVCLGRGHRRWFGSIS